MQSPGQLECKVGGLTSYIVQLHLTRGWITAGHRVNVAFDEVIYLAVCKRVISLRVLYETLFCACEDRIVSVGGALQSLKQRSS